MKRGYNQTVSHRRLPGLEGRVERFSVQSGE